MPISEEERKNVRRAFCSTSDLLIWKEETIQRKELLRIACSKPKCNMEVPEFWDDA